MNRYYKDIFIQDNPWYDGTGLHGTSFLTTDNEPKYMIYTPDIEAYCNTYEQACKYIDEWILKNGTYEEYTFKADMRIGWNRLE